MIVAENVTKFYKSPDKAEREREKETQLVGRHGTFSQWIDLDIDQRDERKKNGLMFLKRENVTKHVARIKAAERQKNDICIATTMRN